jgi:hypothetical protein
MINLSYYAMAAYFLLTHFTSTRGDVLFKHGGDNTITTRQAHENAYEAMIPFYGSIVSWALSQGLLTPARREPGRPLHSVYEYRVSALLGHKMPVQ